MKEIGITFIITAVLVFLLRIIIAVCATEFLHIDIWLKPGFTAVSIVIFLFAFVFFVLEKTFYDDISRKKKH